MQISDFVARVLAALPCRAASFCARGTADTLEVNEIRRSKHAAALPEPDPTLSGDRDRGSLRFLRRLSGTTWGAGVFHCRRRLHHYIHDSFLRIDVTLHCLAR